MTDLTDRANVVDEIIAERPCTITVYRRSAGTTTGETALDSFTGRIDERGLMSQPRSPQHEGPVVVMLYVLLCPQDNSVVQTRDIVKAVDEAGNTTWYNVVGTRDFGYGQECTLVARDDA